MSRSKTYPGQGAVVWGYHEAAAANAAGRIGLHYQPKPFTRDRAALLRVLLGTFTERILRDVWTADVARVLRAHARGERNPMSVFAGNIEVSDVARTLDALEFAQGGQLTLPTLPSEETRAPVRTPAEVDEFGSHLIQDFIDKASRDARAERKPGPHGYSQSRPEEVVMAAPRRRTTRGRRRASAA